MKKLNTNLDKKKFFKLHDCNVSRSFVSSITLLLNRPTNIPPFLLSPFWKSLQLVHPLYFTETQIYSQPFFIFHNTNFLILSSNSITSPLNVNPQDVYFIYFRKTNKLIHFYDDTWKKSCREQFWNKIIKSVISVPSSRQKKRKTREK